MFDWDDSELSNILWDENGNNGDHIVPYPKGREDGQIKEWKEEEEDKEEEKEEEVVVKPKLDLNEKNPEIGSSLVNGNRISGAGMGIEAWPDLPLSDDSTAERRVNAAPEPNNNLSETINFDSGRDRLGKETETYQSNHDSKEQGDFVDYGWANIGSFDDLDRIFSNNDGAFGHSSLGNNDGMWSSSTAVDYSTVKSFPISSDLPSLGPGALLSNRPKHLEIKTLYMQNDDLSCSLSHGVTNNFTSPNLRCGHRIPNRVEDGGGESKPLAKTGVDKLGNRTIAAQNIKSDKVVRKQKKLARSRKMSEEKIQGKQSQESYGSWSSSTNPLGQNGNQLMFPMNRHFPSPVHHMQFIGNELFPYQHLTNQFAARPMYGDLSNPYQPMAVTPPHIQPGNFKDQQLVVPHYNQNSVNKPSLALVKPVTMTPQEKIEKLRRRQQLQAMLAIEKQQQRLKQQVSSSTVQSHPRRNQSIVDLEFDNLSALSSLETNSPREQNDSSAVSAAIEDCSREEIILHRLQDMIKNLDSAVGLCIRDSLFRLARSATQRQNAADVSCSKKIGKEEHETLSKEEIGSYPRLEDGETETNPIDRTVAHLLFFHPPSQFHGKHTEPSESPCSTVNVPETLTNHPLVDISKDARTIALTDDRGTVSKVAVEYSH